MEITDSEKKEPQAANPVQGQAELSVLLDEIEERAHKATEGPWRGNVMHRCIMANDGNFVADTGVSRLIGEGECKTNGDFIASARTDVPALVKALRRAERTLRAVSGLSEPACANALADVTTILNQRNQ